MNKKTFTFIVILLLASVFRLSYLDWGLPNEQHPYSYHPDEAKQLYAISHLDPWHLQFNPHEFIYPSLQYYVNAGALFIASKLGFVKLIPDISYYASHPSDLANLFWVGRLVTALFGIATVALVFVVGKRLYNENAGFIAAFIMAIFPIHIIHSHYMTVDVPLTFWITLTLFFSTYILKEDRWWPYIFAGGAAGLATATKYPGVFAWLLILGAHILRQQKEEIWYSLNANAYFLGPIELIKYSFFKNMKLLISGLIVILTFFLASPYVFLDYPHSIPAILGQWNLPAQVQVDNVGGNGIQYHHFTYQLLAAFPFMLGIPLYLLFLYSLYRSWKESRPQFILLLSFIVPFFLLFATSNLVMLRYYIPFLPFFALIIASTAENNRSGIFRLFVGAILIYTMFFANTQFKMLHEDTQDQAFSWVAENIQENSTLFVSSWAPYRYTPYSDPLAISSNQTNDEHILAKRSGTEIDVGKYNVLTMYNMSPELLNKLAGKYHLSYAILSSLDWNQYYREQSSNQDYKTAEQSYRTFRANPFNNLTVVFDKPYLNEWLYAKLDPRFESDYASPRIEVYKSYG